MSLSDAAARLQHLFIVRMWQESSRAASSQWRGFVEHVPSGQRMYFAALNDLTDFITLRLTSVGDQSTVRFNSEEDHQS